MEEGLLAAEREERLRHDIHELVWVLARELLGAGYDVPPFSIFDAPLEADADAHKAALIAFLSSAEIVRGQLDRLESWLVYRAGHDAGASYAEIGAPFGITKQAARRRWPNAVPSNPP